MTVNNAGRHILFHGLLLVFAGLLWGFAVPQAPFPRLALGAHIQFESNGVLFIVLATIILKLDHGLGPKSLFLLVAAAWMSWVMVISEAANAWWGANKMLPIAASQAGATGGEAWQESIVKITHILAGLSLIIAWAFLIAGFLRRQRSV